MLVKTNNIYLDLLNSGIGNFKKYFLANERLWQLCTEIKVGVGTLTMNIFLHVGRGITFKILISQTVQSRFRQKFISRDIGDDQSAS